MMDDMAIYDEECTVSGAVSGSTYWKYLRSGSSCVSIMRFVISCLITELLLAGSDYWITVWTEMEESRYAQRVNNSSVNSTVAKIFLDLNTETSVYIYTGLTCAFMIFMFVRNIDFFHTCNAASVALHDGMLDAVAFTPISFFENNPIGSTSTFLSKSISSI
jgi:ABC transporter transmembrane region